MQFETELTGRLLCATALTSTLFLANPAAAQEDSARGSTLEVIIVTSERREGNLQNVPVAVSAFSTETIERADISHPIDIANRVPSFTFSPFAPGQAVFSLRGISSNDDGAGTENSVAVFLDDVYFGRISNSAFDFFDAERVEVLRGPQGTLYGKNAIGGALNIVSKKPSTEDFDARLRVMLGNFNTRNIGGYASGPLAGNFAAKVSFALRKHDGYVTNILTGNDLADQDSLSVRGQLLWQTENTEVMLTGWTQDEDNSDMGRIPLPTAGVRPFFDAAGGDVERRLTVTPQEGFSIR
ncbi:MAG: TonB-dependent receptor plug domain-containing protein, partial [Sphingomonadales bacterium]|nr:TonB-dependent receptor plug domain-containing protein [Sphingomonadales bacterium]